MSDRGLVSFDQFAPGLFLNFDRVRRERNYQNWYAGDYTDFFPPPSIDNGFKLHNIKDRIIYPFHKIASQFYTDAAIAERPVVTSDNDQLQAWWDENEAYVYRILEDATREWSITDRVVFITHEDGTFEFAASPDYYRIGEYYDPDTRVGHVLVYLYREYTEAELKNPSFTYLFNRARVLKYHPEENINTVQIFEYSDTGYFGAQIGPTENAGITSITVAGRGDSWYGDSRDVVARFMARLTNNDRALNRSDNRPLVLPSSLLSTYNPEGDPMTPTQKLKNITETVNPVVSGPSASEGNPYMGTIGEAYQYPDEQDLLEYLGQLCYLVAGVPATSFGIGIGEGESGYARERAQDRASARCRAYRSDLQSHLPTILRGMGAPDGKISFSWTTNPFEDKRAKFDELARELQLGAITVDEFRADRGRGKMPVVNAPDGDEGPSNSNGNEEE